VSYGRIAVLGRHLLALLVVCGVAWFFGGLTALIAAASGLVIARVLGPAWVAAAAVGSLLVAAIATVVETKLTHSYSLAFADERPIATHAALVAGALAFVSVAVFAARQRAPVPSKWLPAVHWRLDGSTNSGRTSARSRRSRRSRQSRSRRQAARAK
jgi:hypothetical protein